MLNRGFWMSASTGFDLARLLDVTIWMRLAVAMLCGIACGLEREIHHREAGLRTMMLISLGAALYVMVGEMMASGSGQDVDPTRIAAQVVTGVGFLGAGVIIQQGMAVRGLTTAATIWTMAAIGALVGAGYPLLGFAVTTVMVTALIIVSIVERRYFDHNTRRTVPRKKQSADHDQ